VYAVGLVQFAKVPPSREHWNETPGSESEKLNVASVLATRPEVLVPAMVGTGGATPSWVYLVDDVEHADTLPATSVAVAKKSVVDPVATLTLIPVEVKAAAPPLPAPDPEQVASVCTVTVDPGSAPVPFTEGAVLPPGDAGTVPVTAGAAGAVPSIVIVSDPDDVVSVPPGAISEAVTWWSPSARDVSGVSVKLPPGPTGLVPLSAPSTYSRTLVALGRPTTPRKSGRRFRVMLSEDDEPVSVAAVMSGVLGPEASGAVHGAAGPPTSSNS
jgi:hypothetical protein